MRIQVNTGTGIVNKEALERWVADYLNDCLRRFAQDVRDVEVQLNKESQAARAGDISMRCAMEARIAGHAPVVVRHDAPDQNLAIRGAAGKLEHALERTLGRLDRHEHRSRDTIRKDEVLPITETDTPI